MKINYTTSLLILSLIGMLSIQSCENDVDIYAPEKEVTLIYGLLNADDDLHQFKINRVFQGDDAIENLAKNPSISEYDNISANLIELRDNGFGEFDTTNLWPLTERTIQTKDSGFFYYPDQKIYELSAQLDNHREYVIVVDKLDDSPLVRAQTELLRVNSDILIKPRKSGIDRNGLSLANNEGPHEALSLEFVMPINGKVMDVYLDFSYQDEYLNGSKSEIKTLFFHVGKYLVTNIPSDDGDITVIKTNLNAISFYQFIAAHVPVVPDGSDIKQRVALDFPMEFRFITGGDEFNTYLEVASPSTSLLETKPEYTNVINGIGLFSCRSFNNRITMLSNASIDYLVDGEIMMGRKFCNTANSTSPSYCF